MLFSCPFLLLSPFVFPTQFLVIFSKLEHSRISIQSFNPVVISIINEISSFYSTMSQILYTECLSQLIETVRVGSGRDGYSSMFNGIAHRHVKYWLMSN